MLGVEARWGKHDAPSNTPSNTSGNAQAYTTSNASGSVTSVILPSETRKRHDNDNYNASGNAPGNAPGFANQNQNHILEKKNTKKKRECVLPDFISLDDWELFLSHRKAIKAPITEKMYPSFWKKFESLKLC